MNITTNDILDSLMRAALTPPVSTATDHNGNVLHFAGPSVLDPIVSTVSQEIRNNEELKTAIINQVINPVPDLVPMIQQRLVNYVVEEHKYPGSYGQPSTIKAVIAKWAEEPIQAALLEALQAKIEEHVSATMGDLPLDRYDVNITVNLVPK